MKVKIQTPNEVRNETTRKTVKNPIWLVQQVFNGRPLMRNEVESIISFALDNLMDFDDIPEVWEKIFTKVTEKKMEHYKSTIITKYPENFNPARE